MPSSYTPRCFEHKAIARRGDCGVRSARVHHPSAFRGIFRTVDRSVPRLGGVSAGFSGLSGVGSALGSVGFGGETDFEGGKVGESFILAIRGRGLERRPALGSITGSV